MNDHNLASDPAFHETPVPQVTGAEQANDMERAVVRHQQLQNELATANRKIQRMAADAAAASRTIMRLSDQVDVVKAELASVTEQRNLFMREAIELACSIDTIDALAAANAQQAVVNAEVLRRATVRAKEIAKFKAAEPAPQVMRGAPMAEWEKTNRDPAGITPIEPGALAGIPLRGTEPTASRLPEATLMS